MTDPNTNPPITHGQRIFTCGHSFHVWVAAIVAKIAREAGIADHHTVGTSSIGGSRAIQHWDVPDESNEAKRALRASQVDVLTLSCMTQPDDGIAKFAELAVEHKPDVRVTLQELWLPEDRFPFDSKNRMRTSVDEFNHVTMADLQAPHEAYFAVMEDYANALNHRLGQSTVHIVPDAQATLALRALILAGQAPGLERQSDLFTDAWGHPTAPLKLLSGWTHFSVIYRRNPVGLPLPAGELPDHVHCGETLNRVLQQLAWDAVTQHPMSGVS
jgi:hypothetical protein